MNELTSRDFELVALGAALASNCVSCIEFHVASARRAGLADGQIRAAIVAADQTRQVPARLVMEAVEAVLAVPAPSAAAAAAPCACAALMASRAG